MSVDFQRREIVLAYLREHPPSSARDVAIGALGGPGHSRSPEQQCALRILFAMEREGLVRRVPQAGGGFWGRPILYTDASKP